MKYIIDMSKHIKGTITVVAKDRDEAKEIALSEMHRDEVRWNTDEWITVDEVCAVPLVCRNCNNILPDDSTYCNKCGKKVE